MNWRTGWKDREFQRQLALFLLLLLAYVYVFPRWADPNQNSRLDMVLAVVDDGTFQIDRYVENTVDYARVGDHYYSDKAPGAAFVLIPVYAAMKPVLETPVVASLMERLGSNEAFQQTLRADGSGLLEAKVRLAILQVVGAFLAAALPSALMGVLLYRLLGRAIRDPRPRLLAVGAYALLTPAYAYSNAFYGHQLSAALLVGAYYLIATLHRPPSRARLLVVGALLGFSVVAEYPAALLVVVLSAYAVFVLRRQGRLASLFWIGLSGSMVALAWFAYNNAVFGGPLELGYRYSELWVDQHEAGFLSLTRPHLDALWGITFSRFRGLFLLSPIALLALPGFAYAWRRQELRPEALVSAAALGTMLLFNGSSIMWWGGYAVGPRYLLPALPFIVLPLALTLERWFEHGWGRALVAGAALWSLIAVWGLTLAEQAYPPDTLRDPLLEHAWPNWMAGHVARNAGTFAGIPGAWSLIPLLLALAALAAWSLYGRLPLLRRGGSDPAPEPYASAASKAAKPASEALQQHSR